MRGESARYLNHLPSSCLFSRLGLELNDLPLCPDNAISDSGLIGSHGYSPMVSPLQSPPLPPPCMESHESPIQTNRAVLVPFKAGQPACVNNTAVTVSWLNPQESR